MKNKKNKRIYLSQPWVIRRKLTGVQKQRIIILARVAGLEVQEDAWYFDEDEDYPYLCCSREMGLDLTFSPLPEDRNKYTYKQVLDALIRKAKRNKYKHKS